MLERAASQAADSTAFDHSGPGRVVSVLEGGYGVYEFCKASESGWAISRAQLGENVAAHLSALAGVNPRPQ